MSNLNNQPNTNNNQSVIFHGLTTLPLFLKILWVHSQLTNTPIPNIDFDPPNKEQIYFNIKPDSDRHKAFTQKFFIVDSPVKGIKHTTIHMVGNQSLLYTFTRVFHPKISLRLP